eukprot:364852-Chlamydomonas_euryale.AAC.6
MPPAEPSAAAPAAAATFAELGMDPRLVRSMSKRGFSAPSAVQTACVGAALAGKDVVARARTGSGKTLAYLLPALHRVLANEGSGAGAKGSFQALVLVPTGELCEQARQGEGVLGRHSGKGGESGAL